MGPPYSFQIRTYFSFHSVYVIKWYISVAVRKTNACSYNTSASWSSPKWLASRIGPPNFQCPWSRPWLSYRLEIFRECAQLIFRESHTNFSIVSPAVSEISLKTWGVDENNPLPLIVRDIHAFDVLKVASRVCEEGFRSWDAHSRPFIVFYWYVPWKISA